MKLQDTLSEILKELDEFEEDSCPSLPSEPIEVEPLEEGEPLFDLMGIVELFYNGKLPEPVFSIWQDLLRISNKETDAMIRYLDFYEKFYELGQWAKSELKKWNS